MAAAQHARPGVAARLALGAARALIGRRFTGKLAELRDVERLPPDALRARQAALLRRVAEHAARTVPFWRETFAARGLAPDAIQSVADLQRLPIVDKDVFRSRPIEDFLSDAVPEHRRLPYTTSGSTGDPFRFVLDRAAMPLVFASHLYFDSWFGLDPFDRHVRVMGPPAPDPQLPSGTPARARLRYRLNAALQGGYERLTQRRFTTLDVTADALRRTIESFRPRYLMGYTSTLAGLAGDLVADGWRSPWPMKAIITIAEPLTPERRAVLEDCFRGPVANRYGQREFKYWCAQCPPGDPTRFQWITELVAAEVVDAAGAPLPDGEAGRLILTNLHNFAMPFLRYDTRDVAALGPPEPATGRCWPFIERLDGRSQEVLETPAGKRVDPTTLGHWLFVVRGHVDAVRVYQLVEREPGRVELLVVPAAGFRADTADRLAADVRDLVGPGTEVTVRSVADIPLESSGKRPILKLCRPAASAHVR